MIRRGSRFSLVDDLNTDETEAELGSFEAKVCDMHFHLFADSIMHLAFCKRGNGSASEL